MAGEISNYKFAAPNGSYDFIVNLVVVLLAVDSERIVTCVSYCSFHSSMSFVHRFIKPHGNKSDIALSIGLIQRKNMRPAFWDLLDLWWLGGLDTERHHINQACVRFQGCKIRSQRNEPVFRVSGYSKIKNGGARESTSANPHKF
jgi:hypothetical protein